MTLARAVSADRRPSVSGASTLTGHQMPAPDRSVPASWQVTATHSLKSGGERRLTSQPTTYDRTAPWHAQRAQMAMDARSRVAKLGTCPRCGLETLTGDDADAAPGWAVMRLVADARPLTVQEEVTALLGGLRTAWLGQRGDVWLLHARDPDLGGRLPWPAPGPVVAEHRHTAAPRSWRPWTPSDDLGAP